MLVRHSRNRCLCEALYQQAFCALTTSPGARAYYDAHRARGNIAGWLWPVSREFIAS